MNSHEDLEWTQVEIKMDANTEKLWSLNEMESTGGETDVVVGTKRRANLFFIIVHRKVLKMAGAFVMIVKPWHQESNPNYKEILLMWLLK